MTDDPLARAAELDATDPLARFRDRFAPAGDVRAYLDGNSLGRPLLVTRDRLAGFVEREWGQRLIRGWDEGWLDEPLRAGDTLGRVVLGAAPGQTVVADSTSVLLYKLARAAVDARPDRRVLVCDADDFPTDRFVTGGIAAERGLRLRRIEGGRTPDRVAAAVAATPAGDTALVVLSHVDYRSGELADAAAITDAAHRHGAWVLLDVSHSVGVLPVELDAWGVDLAVGCTYKYLNGGPGSPAFGYVRAGLRERLRQPVHGWMGAEDPFAMGEPDYRPAGGMRRFLSGTPPVLALQPVLDMVELIEEVGLPAIRAKSIALTTYAGGLAGRLLARHGVVVTGPDDPARRGGHVTLAHPHAREATDRLWRRGVIPDFRPPDGIRIGLSPLSTAFTEVADGLTALDEVLDELAGG